MKITKVETIHVLPRWLFLKIHTDEGIIGLGEPVVEGRSQTVAAAIKEIADRYLIGQDPLKITKNWQAIFIGQFYQGGPVLMSAIAGIDQALWDIKGKFYNTPVYELLGGSVRDQVKLYGHFGGNTKEEMKASIDAAKAKGYTSFKTSIGGPVKFIDTMAKVNEFAENIALTRELVGPECDFGVDFHGRVSPAMAMILIKAIEEFQPMFIEEPVLPGNVDELARVARSTYIPIATGERLFTKFQFREVLEKQAAVVLQPDLSHAGGITECRDIAALAAASYATMAPHCPLGPIALAACIQLDFAVPNFLCQESVTLGDGYIKKPFVVKNGSVELPTKPGLGIELDEDAIEEKKFDGSWETPRFWYEDGGVASW